MGLWKRVCSVAAFGFVAGVFTFWIAAAAAADTKPAPGVISGKIILEDGSPAKVEVSLHSETSRPEIPGSLSSVGQGRARGEYSVQVEPGSVWLKCFAKGYAPVAIGPFTVAPGETVDNTLIQLRRGREARVKIVSTDAKAIKGASLLLSPYLGHSANGESTAIRVGDNGETTLEHLADADYSVRVKAPGHEPLDVDHQAFPSDGPTEIVMTPTKPATGRVFTADGKPANGAKVELKIEGSKNGSHAYYGTIAATTDAEGRFTLDQLSSAQQYLFIVEGADGSRAIVRNLRPGVEGVEVKLPKDQNLRIHFTGDVSRLKQRNGRTAVILSQTLVLDPAGLRHSAEMNGICEVKPTDDGGVGEYRGLVSGEVRINYAGEFVTANVVENGLTEVTIDLDKDKAK